jgi:O-acetyl-ADP-ribose deacetylase (regulator of RNase III)
MIKISIQKGDITLLNVDAIVNAANTSLSGGTGVNGAIHRAAGPDLAEACRQLNGCATGEAKLTSGYQLAAKHIIHTPGPVWGGGKENEVNLLHDCYHNSLLLAMENNIRSIAFPNISTGVYGFPKDKAAMIALFTVNQFCREYPEALSEVIFVCYDDENYNIYKGIIGK